MSNLDLRDIQGNIHRPYGRFGFPHSRHFFFAIKDVRAGRDFVQAIRPRVTTAEPWKQAELSEGLKGAVKPSITLNIGFSWEGLRALAVPTETLRLFPEEFIEGMRARAPILGDVEGSAPSKWDAIWRKKQVHIWVSLNSGAKPDGTPTDVMTEWTDWLQTLATGGVELITGHGTDGKGNWQHSSAMMAPLGPNGSMVPLPKEHFGFVDGISDPAFKGEYANPEVEALAVRGGGKLEAGPLGSPLPWKPLATGEFILGQADEGQQFPVATRPASFARNGSFMVYRKLRQDVALWDDHVGKLSAQWMAVTGETDPVAASETVRAKMVGRWSSGLPLIVAPTWAAHQAVMAEYADAIAISKRGAKSGAEKKRQTEYKALLTDFRFGGDVDGKACPLGAHIRRAHPRDMLDPEVGPNTGSTALTNRRRIIRRGLPYEDSATEKGVVFMALCASIFRQFEFVQQQWMNYGLDFDAGNDTCPVIGNRQQSHKYVIPPGEANAETFIAANLPEFVTTRGGEYFFIPGMNAIRMIAMGTVDPT